MAKKCATFKGRRKDDPVTFDRVPYIVAAGVPTKRDDIKDLLKHYLLQDDVDAILSDAVEPPVTKPLPLPPLRHPKPQDKRFAFYTNVGEVANPPIKPKFTVLTDEIKDTTYASYWKKPLGHCRDPAPMFPAGMKYNEMTFGKYTARSEDAKTILYPDPPIPEEPMHKRAGVQKHYMYCSPPYKGDLVFGHKYNVDIKGSLNMRDSLIDNAVTEGRAMAVLMTALNADYRFTTHNQLGKALHPIENIKFVPEGHRFGIQTRKSLDGFAGVYVCDPNPQKEMYMSSLAFINSLRKIMRKHLAEFFRSLYLELKYLDKDQSGWLPKDVIYKYLQTKLIRLNPNLVEPLFKLWKIDDGSCFHYKSVIDIINYTIPLPNMPKIHDFPQECLLFETTYKEMTKPCQEIDQRKQAGIPSGRYFDLDYPITPENCCKADQICLPQESDMKACICPSIMTRNFVSHRDMYAKREPDVLRRIFETAGDKFTDEQFDELWKEAQKYHSQGWVCFETFRKVLESKK